MAAHVIVPVADYERSKDFYARALAPLGYVVLMDWRDKRRAYLGPPGRPSSLWLVEATSFEPVDVRLPAALPQLLVDPDGNRVAIVPTDEADLRAA
jgi:catechol 2,3-dioxygenase-like lactoylglutathione lyase family enzyme